MNTPLQDLFALSVSDGGAEDPFVEVAQELVAAREALLQCFGGGDSSARSAYMKQAALIARPVLQLATAAKHKATALRKERENARCLDELKAAVFSKCHSLGEDATAFVAFRDPATGGILSFEASVRKLRNALSELDVLEEERLTACNELIQRINTVKRELGEDGLLDPPRKPRAGHSGAGHSSLIPAPSPAAAAHVRVHQPKRQQRSAFDELYENTGEMVDDAAAGAAEADDISRDRIALLKMELAAAQQRREAHVKMLGELCREIVAMWREDGHVPTQEEASGDERRGASGVEAQLVRFAKAGAPADRVLEFLDADFATFKKVVATKSAMMRDKQDRVRSSLEMSRRLRLIEDRQFILAAMRRFEARCKNPLRLFGNSEQLLREEECRARLYPRLLLIESILRPALVRYREQHRRPFIYQGSDYLQLMDEELRTRVVPRHLFPLAPSPAQQHASLRHLPDRVLRLLTGPAEDREPDFSRVLQLSTTVDDVVAEQVLSQQQRLEDIHWSQLAAKSAEHVEAERRELQLLQLGWRLPEGMPPDRIMAIDSTQARLPRKPPRGSQTPLLPNLGDAAGGDDADDDAPSAEGRAPLRAPVPPPLNVAPKRCRARHNRGAACHPSLLDVELSPTAAQIAEPPTSRVVPAEVLLRGTRRGVRAGASTDLERRPRLRLSSVQLRNIRTPKHIRYADTDSARKLKEEVDAAYRFK